MRHTWHRCRCRPQLAAASSRREVLDAVAAGRPRPRRGCWYTLWPRIPAYRRGAGTRGGTSSQKKLINSSANLGRLLETDPAHRSICGLASEATASLKHREDSNDSSAQTPPRLRHPSFLPNQTFLCAHPHYEARTDRSNPTRPGRGPVPSPWRKVHHINRRPIPLTHPSLFRLIAWPPLDPIDFPTTRFRPPFRPTQPRHQTPESQAGLDVPSVRNSLSRNSSESRF